MKKISLKVKLISLFLLVGLLPVIIISVMSFYSSSENIQHEVFIANDAFGLMIEGQLNDYIDQRSGNAVVIANTGEVYQSANALYQAGWDTGDIAWQERMAGLNSYTRTVMDEFGYAFIFITNPQGRVVYSTRDELMGANLSDRAYVQGALKGSTTWSEIFFSDVVNIDVMVVSAPILTNGRTGQIIGTVNLISPLAEIQAEVHSNIAQLGETADAYLVNEDGLLLTNTMLGAYQQGAALNQSIDTEGTQILSSHIRANNNGFTHQGIYPDYLGNNVLGSLRTVELGDMMVGLIVEIDQDEAYAGVYALRFRMILIAAISSIIIAVVGSFVAASIVRPVQQITKLANRLAERDFTEKTDVKSRDEIGEMAGSLNQTVDALSNALARVRESSNMVSFSAEEISTGNQDLSQRTEEQASSLEELASTIEEMTSSLESASLNAIEANSLSNETLSSVKQGEEVVQEMQHAMTDITKGSQEISEIIGTVNDIAFQTNLLALNAAVEAARAGEQGRGFAVVASEVRNLAGRSAEAAKEIEKLIKDSIVRVDLGNTLMSQTEKVLLGIVVNTQKTTDIVGEISASLKEQSSAAGDIRSAIEELNEVTQQNASLVEEIASSSENMSSEALELAQLVEQFKIADQKNKQLSAPKKPTKSQNSKPHQPPKSAGSANRRVAAAKEQRPTDNNLEMFDMNDDDFEKF